jgi:hypothetical protein
MLLATSRLLATSTIGLSNSVTVLDFTSEAPPVVANDRTVGLADYVEVALQKEGVPTLERRQVRLILGERDLHARGILAEKTLHAAKLPTVAYFIGGNVGQRASNEFALTLSIIRAETASVAASLTRRGVYPAGWLPAIESLAKEVRMHFRSRSWCRRCARSLRR